MEVQEKFVNKVAESGLMTLNLEDYYDKNERVVYDLKENLFQGLILREKDFREFVKENDWAQYQNKNVAIICSADAIVPTWAYMLLATKLKPYANEVVFGGLDALESVLFVKKITALDFSVYANQRVVVKGCADFDVPATAYVQITNLLLPIAKSIMYGEPCSTVPIYKRKD